MLKHGHGILQTEAGRRPSGARSFCGAAASPSLGIGSVHQKTFLDLFLTRIFINLSPPISSHLDLSRVISTDFVYARARGLFRAGSLSSLGFTHSSLRRPPPSPPLPPPGGQGQSRFARFHRVKLGRSHCRTKLNQISHHERVTSSFVLKSLGHSFVIRAWKFVISSNSPP